jgi:hypothetical protein
VLVVRAFYVALVSALLLFSIIDDGLPAFIIQGQALSTQH